MARSTQRLPSQLAYVLRPRAVLALAACASLCEIATVRAAQEHSPDFASEVRPILADHCFACHGPDAHARRPRSRPLRLDREGDLHRPRTTGTVIERGDPQRSLLWQRITADEPSERMPPLSSKHELDAEEIDVLRRWIENGAPFAASHWAFELVRKSEAPTVAEDSWSRAPLDAYLLAAMQRAGLRPNEDADARTLVRRLSFDLCGLPPDPADVDAFVADPSDQRWAELVDTYLSSAEHAERMATFWLDLVRYADSTGIHADNPWHSAPYRTWVVQAFQDNLPFDQFTREQLAGDLLPEATRAQRVAAAYCRLNPITREGGSQAKEFLARYTADRVRNCSEVWLALTLGCAECHDHKFDPLTTREFYEFGAFFADIEQRGVYDEGSREVFGPEMGVPTPQQEAAASALDTLVERLETDLAAETPALIEDRRRFRQSIAAQEAQWHSMHPSALTSRNGARYSLDDADWILATGPSSATESTVLDFAPIDRPITALRLELRPDDRLPAHGPGRASNGNFVLSELEVFVDGERVAIEAARSSFDQIDYPIQHAIDGGGGRPGWAILDTNGPERHSRAEFTLSTPIQGGSPVRLVMFQEHGSEHTLGSFRWSAKETEVPGVGAPVESLHAQVVFDGALVEAALAAEQSSSDERLAEFDRVHRGTTPLLADVRAQLEATRNLRAELDEEIPRVLETRAVPPMVVRVLPRGNWRDESGDIVEPSVPEVLGELPDLGRRPTRLDLANWLVRPDHPLVARVMVNRLWRLCFGRGLVSTLDDFGMQGSSPSHPELLDRLAADFVNDGWDVRAVLWTLVSSHAYRQSSRLDPERADLAAADRWFARQASYRLDAEFVRDQALASSGLLVRAVGGPSVRPYQPGGYWAHLNFPPREYEPSTGADLYRRSLYMHWQRLYLHPSLLAFDAPARDRCIAERDRSNTPQAALVLLNDPIFVECARVLATQVLASAARDDLERLDLAFRRTLQRQPTDDERERLLSLLREHRTHYRSHPEEATALQSVGEAPSDPAISADECAAWTSIGRVLLNLHETIVRR